MGGLESKGDHSQRTLSNLLRREKVGHLFSEEQWRFMGAMSHDLDEMVAE